MDLVEFIYQSNQCSNIDELTRTFLKFLSQYGLDRFVFSEMSHDSTSQKETHHGLLVNYPQEWMEHYVSSHYVDIDPVYQTALTARGPFTWRMAEQQSNISSQSKLVMEEAREFKLYDGIGLAIHRPLGQIFGMGFAGSEKGVEHNKDALSIIYAASQHFFVVYADLSDLETRMQKETALTNREREVLLWVARGKTKTEIGDILSISESTVKRYCEHIFLKLEVNTASMAVAKALRMGLIKPF